MVKRLIRIDWAYLLIVIILIAIGLLMMFSTSSVPAFSSYNNSYFFINRHIFYLVIGSFALLTGLLISPEKYRKYAVAGMLISIFLVSLTFVPGIGVKILGANRWLNLYVIQLQPVEVLKFFIAIFLALSLANKKETIRSFKKGILPIILMLGLPIAILARQPDLGNAILILAVFFTLIFLSKARVSHLLYLIATGLSFVGISVWRHSYQLQRIRTFLDPWKDPTGKSYHIVQSLIAVGSGGIWGLGLGQSKLKYFYLPLQYSDFIFSIICEEGGFIFGAFVVFLYGLLFFKGIQIALKTTEPFLFYLCLGLTLFLVFQALVNIGVAIGLCPTTGIPLTFISFGGTSLVCSMFYAGVIMRIASESQS